MKNDLIISFRADISSIEQTENEIVLKNKNNSLNLQHISPGILEAIAVLCAEGETEEKLSQLVLEKDGHYGLSEFYYYLETFIKIGLICHTVKFDEGTLATLLSNSSNYKFQFKKVVLDKNYILSRFAYCHREDDRLILESPLSFGKIILNNWRSSAIVTELAKPVNCLQLCQQISDLTEETIQLFLSLLLSADMLAEAAGENKEIQTENSPLAQWEFQDLLFHSQIRTGRQNKPIGRTYRFWKQIPQLPVVKPKVSEEIIDLYKPEFNEQQATDPYFTTVLESRRSIRSFGKQPITDRQLGEFLYRSARVKKLTKTDIEELSNRPYPSAGACYELEFYLAINSCQNIASGFYHYCPQEHQLGRISGLDDPVKALLEEARINNPQKSVPQILIILAARFQRASWYYESIAYAGILKNVGAVFQTMYLVATALGLAPCALGYGNSDLFAAASGTDYYAETSVGEFILGSKPEN
ncbi:MAG: SagB family peptide dehydrogenase [Prochloraceae cyanobacterium]|nr:SagB family peptide dehydrogenase [Prochloraceae cyanobacterium]